MQGHDEKSDLTETEEEIMEINYDPVPGYRPAFFAILAVAAGYLVYAFLRSAGVFLR